MVSNGQKRPGMEYTVAWVVETIPMFHMRIEKLCQNQMANQQVFVSPCQVPLLEIGVNKSGNLLLADEISPDSCRIWDQRSNDPNNRILDKDRFRKDLGGVVDAYGEILKRIQGVSSKPRNCS